ncbi:MAG TPA: zinc-binding alcohol dehydrogenase [Acidimicrobiales bacterium]|nr:zinc-binding alcohol dehydrogenase [Acidimicrobiales bacterium]
MVDEEGLAGTALVAEPDGVFRLADVVTAPLGRDDIAVRTLWSGVSIGTEFAVLTGKLDWGSFPLVTGYMATGVVSAVGRDVTGFAIGDTVYYRRNASLQLRGTGAALNCRSGTHSSVAVLNPSGDHGADIVPAGVSAETASLFVMPAVGLYGVDMAYVGVGATVAVIGLGMIGLGVVSAAVRRGAVVIGIDPRPECRALAETFGAVATLSTDEEGSADRITEVAEKCGGTGADFVFEATGRPECIDAGIQMCRPFGCFVWQGNYGDGPASFEFLEAHRRRLRMVFPCDDGYRAYRRASLQAVASGAMPWGEVITHRIPYEEMPGFYRDIFDGKAPSVIGAVINWQSAA